MKWLLLAAVSLASSCGYGVMGKADLLPKSVKTIAIPAWGNLTDRYKVGDRLSGALTREFISRTRYQIVADPNQAGAILTGTVLQVLVILQMRLTERATGKILFDRPQFEARQRYEISIDAAAYFEESSTAIDRLARDVARDAVSAILEGF